MKRALSLLALALALAGCGGSGNTGSDGTGVAPPPTDPTVASGPLTSLGPLGVAGATLNDTSTQVLLNATAARSARCIRRRRHDGSTSSWCWRRASAPASSVR